MKSSDRFVREFMPDALGALSGVDPFLIKDYDKGYWLASTFNPFGSLRNCYATNLEALAWAVTHQPNYFRPGFITNLFTPHNLLLTSIPKGCTSATIIPEISVMSTSTDSEKPDLPGIDFKRAQKTEDYETAIAVQRDGFRKWIRVPDFENMAGRIINNPAVSIYNAFEGEKAVGTSSVVVHPDLSASMWEVTTLERNRGIGSALTKHVLSQMAEQGVEQVHLLSYSNSLNFYKFNGFAEESRLALHRLQG